jgi:hypothetical protein
MFTQTMYTPFAVPLWCTKNKSAIVIWQIVSAILPARPDKMLEPQRSPVVRILACQIAVARLTDVLNRYTTRRPNFRANGINRTHPRARPAVFKPKPQVLS